MNTFIPKSLEFEFADSSEDNMNENNHKDILHFQQWIEHGIWSTRNLIKLCRKTIKYFKKHRVIASCGIFQQKSCDCEEMFDAYDLLDNSIFTLHNISSYINNNIWHVSEQCSNLCICLFEPVFDFINTLKCATYDCIHFKKYLASDNEKRYRTMIYQLLSVLKCLSRISLKRSPFGESANKMEKDDLDAMALKYEYIQQIPFFRDDLLTFAYHEGINEFDDFYITFLLITHIETMLTFEKQRYFNNDSDNSPNGVSKSKSFVEFLFDSFDGKFIDFIIRCASCNTDHDVCLIGMECISKILSIVTQENYKYKRRGFNYICRLFDKKQFNLLPIIIHWVQNKFYDTAICFGWSINDEINNLAFECVASMIQYQIRYLTSKPKPHQNKSIIFGYNYPYSNSQRSKVVHRNLEFIDESTQKLTQERLERIAKETYFFWQENSNDDLIYDLKFYELIHETNGTPNSVIIAAIKSMNREWTPDTGIKLYEQYFDPRLKSSIDHDFFNQYPSLYLLCLKKMFLKYIRDKKLQKAVSILESIDKSMHYVAAHVFEAHSDRKDWVIINELLNLAHSKQQKFGESEQYLVMVKNKYVHMPTQLVAFIQSIYHLYKNEKMCDHNCNHELNLIINNINIKKNDNKLDA